jgi:hypothetical protein
VLGNDETSKIKMNEKKRLATKKKQQKKLFSTNHEANHELKVSLVVINRIDFQSIYSKQ